jgi:hypothetical protein
MKKILSLCAFIAMSVFVFGQKPLQYVYFDRADANIERLSSLTEEQASFFAQYEQAIQQVSNGADLSDYFIVETASDASDAVSPLLGNIIYDQGVPFNNLCPIINGRRAVTGCVATAMAQIMRYYSYPSVGTGSVTYTGSNGAATLNLADYDFDWSLILNDYTKSYTPAQGEAVAKLMLACGASINMNYSADGSGSHLNKAMKALKDNFGYSKDIEYYDSTGDYDPEGLIEYDWVFTIRENHQKGYPVMYAGSPASGKSGHAFVIDGYKVIDGLYYYHVNWGWSGYCNGYYLILNLKPDGENYAGYGCDMVVNIHPVDWIADVEDVVVPQLDNKIYNLLGVEVDENYKGIVIKNGQKYIQ